jgi:hypothetical protein
MQHLLLLDQLHPVLLLLGQPALDEDQARVRDGERIIRLRQTSFLEKKKESRVRPGAYFGTLFRGKFRGKLSPKNVGENWNFPQKKFRKIVFPGNSEENSAESDFLRKKCTKNDDGTVQRVIVSASGNDVGGFDPPPSPARV